MSTILVFNYSLLLLVRLKRNSCLLNEPHRSTKCNIRILSLNGKGQETLVLFTNAVKIKESTGWTAKAKSYIRNSEWSQSKFFRFPAESWESAELGLWTSSFAITKRKCKLKTELEPEPPCLIAKTRHSTKVFIIPVVLPGLSRGYKGSLTMINSLFIFLMKRVFHRPVLILKRNNFALKKKLSTFKAHFILLSIHALNTHRLRFVSMVTLFYFFD